jgi:hypothetical protein
MYLHYFCNSGQKKCKSSSCQFLSSLHTYVQFEFWHLVVRHFKIGQKDVVPVFSVQISGQVRRQHLLRDALLRRHLPQAGQAPGRRRRRQVPVGPVGTVRPGDDPTIHNFPNFTLLYDFVTIGSIFCTNL